MTFGAGNDAHVVAKKQAADGCHAGGNVDDVVGLDDAAGHFWIFARSWLKNEGFPDLIFFSVYDINMCLNEIMVLASLETVKYVNDQCFHPSVAIKSHTYFKFFCKTKNIH